MNYIEHKAGNGSIIEIQSEEVLVNSEQDVLDLMANVNYLYDSNRIILHTGNLNEDFFKLRTGLAGGILQKFSNYRVRAAIVGEVPESSKSLKAFILESNRSGRVFLPVSCQKPSSCLDSFKHA